MLKKLKQTYGILKSGVALNVLYKTRNRGKNVIETNLGNLLRNLLIQARILIFITL